MTAPAWTTRERDIVLDGRRRKQSAVEIAERLERRTPDAVHQFCTKMRRSGDPEFAARINGRPRTFNVARAAQMRSRGMTCAQIGQALGVCKQNISRSLKSAPAGTAPGAAVPVHIVGDKIG